MGAFAAIAGVVGAVSSTVGILTQGLAAGRQAAYQSQVAANNAIIAQQNANYAIQAGEAKATDIGLQERGKLGAVTAGLAANNLNINTGSAADTRETQREMGEINIQRERQAGQLNAYGFRSQEAGFTAESQLLQSEAQQAPIGAAFGAAGSLLSRASDLPAKFSGQGGYPSLNVFNVADDLA